MKRLEKRSVVKEVVVEVTCDGCGKRFDGDDPPGWARFDSYHTDWGSDSEETWHQWDACGWPCYLAIVRSIVADYGRDLATDALEQGSGATESTLVVDEKDWRFIGSLLAAHPEPVT